MKQSDQEIVEGYTSFISSREFPCVAAREAVARQQVSCYVTNHMACPADDYRMLEFLYEFIDQYRKGDGLFHSAAIIFRQSEIMQEEEFDNLMWQRLQAISNMDARQFGYDPRVTTDPTSKDFSFSLKEEAFFIIGLHPQSSRLTRQFHYPVLTFNPHAQFEKMRETAQYNKLKNIVRKRDIAYSGSINPMLDDFGGSSEVYQYSGRQYDQQWKCPLNINHGKIEYSVSPERSGF